MLPNGAVACSSVLSVVASTIGLVVLGLTRPSDAKIDDTSNVYITRIVGVFGALLYFIGLALGSIPWLVGVWNDVEGKASIMVQQMLVLACLVSERCILGRAPHPLIAIGCVVVWFGSTLIEWAGPRPYDSMLSGLEGQIAGCDGGYRTPFLIYAPLWLSVVTFGAVFLCFNPDGRCDNGEDDSSEDDIGSASLLLEKHLKQERIRALRRKLLPIVYGFAMSMSGIVCASGTARDDMTWVTLGVCLMALSVVCAWECLWSLDMTLGTWALLSQNTYTLLRFVQGHLVFRDFRWNANSEIGYFIVWKWPGVWFFLLGFFLTVTVTVLFLSHSEEDEGDVSTGTIVRAGSKTIMSSANSVDSDNDGYRSDGYKPTMAPACRCLVMGIQWLLFFACITSFYFGITLTILDFKYGVPGLQWHGGNETTNHTADPTADGTELRTASGQSYLQLITTLYDKRLPCSAMVIAFNSVCRAPLQFASFVVVMLRPSILPVKVLQNLQTTFLIEQSRGWFVNVFVLMLLAAFLNLTGPTGAVSFITLLDTGFWWFLLFTITSVMIGVTFDLFPETGAFRGETSTKVTRRISRESQDSESDYGSEKNRGSGSQRLLLVGTLGLLLFVIIVALVLGLTKPFLDFDYRVSGVIVKTASPTLYEILQATLSPTLKGLEVMTLVVALIVWLPCFALAFFEVAPGAFGHALEQLIRPWVLLEMWAVSVLIIYYIVSSRNKAPIEVCAKFPEDMSGILAIVVLFGAGKALTTLAKKILSPVTIPKSAAELPGGNGLWSGGFGLLFVGLILGLYFHGPPVEKELSDLEDFNHMMSASVPTLNLRIQDKIPKTVGSCDGFWAHSVQKGEVAVDDIDAHGKFMQTCRGKRAIAEVNKGTLYAEATWATGLDTIQIMQMQVHKPVNISNVTKNWIFNLDAKFTDVHIWLKATLGGKPWIDDYMCCDNPFHFSLQASANCTSGQGFHSVKLHTTQIDPIELQHEVVTENVPGFSSSYEVNYGGYDAIEQSLKNFLTLKNGHLLIRNANGSHTDAMEAVGDVLKDVFLLNTGRHCPDDYTAVSTSAPAAGITPVATLAPTAVPIAVPIAVPTAAPAAPIAAPTAAPTSAPTAASTTLS